MSGDHGEVRRATIRRCGTALVIVAFVIGMKSVQLALWPDPGGIALVPGLVRQATLVTVLFVALALCLGPAGAAGAVGWSWRRGRRWLVVVAGIAAALSAVGDPPGRSLLTLVLVTAVGEEVLFRGLLGALLRAIGHADGGARRVAVAAFAAWHLPDVVPDGVLAGIAVLVATGAAAALVFEPLRRRTGSVFAPAAAHLLLNGCGLLLTAW